MNISFLRPPLSYHKDNIFGPDFICVGFPPFELVGMIKSYLTHILITKMPKCVTPNKTKLHLY